jgi:hypothetical protein
MTADSMSNVYPPSLIKRQRATKAEVEQRRDSLYEIVGEMQPMSVRQVFYQASVRFIVDKLESGYEKVAVDLVKMRRAGVLPYDWLTDSTRWMRKPNTYNSVQEALEETARLYRKNLWRDADAYVEVWLEKDALGGVVEPLPARYDVPLMIARGYASLCTVRLSTSARWIVQPTFTISATTILPASTRQRRSNRLCARWHRMPKLFSNASPSR